MSPGATFERVYLELKRQLMEGRRPLGAPLEPKILGEELAASSTPVRDALHRLVGEGLVEAPRHNGFHVPRITEAGLRDLYAWNGQVMGLAARSIRSPMPSFDPASQSQRGNIGDAVAALFLDIGRLGGNSEQERAIGHLNDRLASCRQAESSVLAETAAELAGLQVIAGAGDRTALTAALVRYHRRRLGAVSRIVERLTSGLAP